MSRTAAVNEPAERQADDPASVAPDSDYLDRKANRYRLAALRRHAGRRLLDVGCGNGAYVFALRDTHDAEGLDIQRFPQWAGAPERFHLGSATDLPFPDASFDTVSCFETLEHLEEPEHCLRELRRVTRDNVVITVPNCEVTRGLRESNLIYSHWSDPTHVQFFTKADIERMVESSGFDIVESRLINPIKPWPFILELIGLRGRLHRLASKALKRLPQNRYFITTLVVARKSGADG